MKPTLCLLLPLVTAEDLERFDGLPADALSAPGNVPALSERYRPVLCPIAPTALLERLQASERWASLARHAECHPVAIDDLVVDYPFDVVPSLAYWTAMVARGDAMLETAYVFLQPNLVLADGSLRHVARRLAGEADVIWGTYLHVEESRFVAGLSSSVADGDRKLSARSVVRHALECLDIRDLANIVNLDLSISGPVGRLMWQHDRSTLLAYDFLPSLVALRPFRKPEQPDGFRDVAFARAMCPNGAAHHLTDSEEFVGVELTGVSSADAISGARDDDELVRELSRRAAHAQLVAAARFPIVFQAGDRPSGFSRSAARASAYIRRLGQMLAQHAPENLQPRFWKLGMYLWAVRRFELGRGPLPEAPWIELSMRAESDPVAPPERRSAAAAILVRIVRFLRDYLIGRAPLITFLHPDWLDYRFVIPALRSASGMQKGEVLYVGDGAAILSRVLGAPSYISAQLLQESFELPLAKDSLNLVVMELTAASMVQWPELVNRVIPAMKAGGRIVMLHYNAGLRSGYASRRAIALGWSRLNASRFPHFSMSVIRASEYKTWLRHGYPIVLSYLRRRRPLSVLKGALLFCVLNTLTLALNIASIWPGRTEARTDASSSVTIIIDV